MQTPLRPFRAKPFVGHSESGFSLVEIAIVMVVLSFLIVLIGVPLASQIDRQRSADTQKQLEVIKEALLGYALANGRLPCPATDGSVFGTSNSNGVESPISTGACTVKLGYVPAVTLGLSPVDSSGFAVDAWSTPANRILYGVADISFPVTGACAGAIPHALTAPGGMKAATMDCLAPKTWITVCSSTPTGGSPGHATACAAGATLTTTAPFVLISRGKNAVMNVVANSDEAHNVDQPTYANQDLFFVSRTPTSAGAAGGEFDDIVTWPSLNTLFARMVQAGKLP